MIAAKKSTCPLSVFSYCQCHNKFLSGRTNASIVVIIMRKETQSSLTKVKRLRPSEKVHVS